MVNSGSRFRDNRASRNREQGVSVARANPSNATRVPTTGARAACLRLNGRSGADLPSLYRRLSLARGGEGAPRRVGIVCSRPPARRRHRCGSSAPLCRLCPAGTQSPFRRRMEAAKGSWVCPTSAIASRRWLSNILPAPLTRGSPRHPEPSFSVCNLSNLFLHYAFDL